MMTRADIERMLSGHREAAARQRELEVEESRDVDAAIARTLSLIAAVRATIPAAVSEAQRVDEDERVRETWNTLRRKLAR